MKKLLTKIAIVAAGFTSVAYAQQDPQFTQFMFNKLIYNPGYAGTSGAICGVAQYRKQWVNFPGAPTSMAFAGDMRLSALPIGVGLNVMTDKIGAMSTFFMRGAGSFLLPLGSIKGKPGTLGLGLDVGILQKQINNTWITPQSGPDIHIPGTTSFTANGSFNKVSLDLGFGAFYQVPGKMYVGLSSTHLPAQSLKQSNLGFKVQRHYYFMAGYTFEINRWLDVMPNVMYKTDVSASSLDLNVNLMWFKQVWVGGTYRFNDAAAVLLGYQRSFAKDNAMTGKIGISYDFPTSKLSGYTSGTLEFVLGVCFTPAVKKETTYIDDRYWGKN
ncbi:MAG: type IX secretion system membrane protein PorP/SprF [Bacteroidia bacterium]|nr:type IX secretion system membrane protein PorP/SprF [Bacteroidia bacterium]